MEAGKGVKLIAVCAVGLLAAALTWVLLGSFILAIVLLTENTRHDVANIHFASGLMAVPAVASIIAGASAAVAAHTHLK